jgi:hypothetical protein
VEPYRERIEDFMRRWRSQYEGDRVFRVLVIMVVLAALGATSAGLQQTPTYEASAGRATRGSVDKLGGEWRADPNAGIPGAAHPGDGTGHR